jgi:Golgi phosphoprotein 3 GPP34
MTHSTRRECQLTGPALLADEFFLVAHHDVTGMPRLLPGGVALGLAAALIGELMLFDRVTVSDGELTVTDHRPPPDTLGRDVLAQLLSRRHGRDLTGCLAELSETVAVRVGIRLERAGCVRRSRARQGLRRQLRWVPVDRSMAARPGGLLRYALDNENRLGVPEALLAGLITATGLDRIVFWGMSTRTRQYRDWCLSTLREPLRELVTQTTVAIGDAALANRG